MIPSERVQKVLNDYVTECREHEKRPKMRALAIRLCTSPATIRRGIKGYYRPFKPYTKYPHYTRVLSNEDIERIQNAFKGI